MSNKPCRIYQDALFALNYTVLYLSINSHQVFIEKYDCACKFHLHCLRRLDKWKRLTAKAKRG